MNISWGQGCLLVIALTFLIASIEPLLKNPVALIIVLAVIALLVFMIVRYRRGKRIETLNLLEQQAQNLAKLAEGNFEVENLYFTTKQDEVVVHRLEKVVLKEYRSAGSNFGGGYGGVSIPLFGNVGANVGGMRGGSTRKPEESTPIDVGVVTFTNQRIVFAGDNVVREFDLDKLVNLEAGDNGITLEISVSNRDKTSVLQAANMPDLTPGMAASIALAWRKDGKQGAMADAKDLRDRLSAVVENDRKKLGKL